ncbi:hypothetical protein IUY40_10735 [Flavobacterium sp. ALJ2]|uniref:hypothetical protein n=1 Tax=Flavobacterium sp. ALJ2 TaxID=2786960 RepID=UPI00189F6FF5|nr:hypothetical protein [Flavobacterium sp. ALJ2]MBF7092014.1 hypothetical protein [Flavobacterium sp. ALJ2]
MKIKNIFLFIILFALFSCAKKNDIIKNDITIRNLKGNVKSIYEWSYNGDSLKDKNTRTKLHYSSDYIFGYDLIYLKFDKLGKIQNHNCFDFLGIDNSKKKTVNTEFTIYKYNSYGDKTEIITKFDTLSDDVFSKTLFKYNDIHQILEMTTKSYIPKIEYYYADEFLQTQIGYDSYDRRSEEHSFKYGSNDSISEYEIYDYLSDDITLREIYTYDNSNNLKIKEVSIAKRYKKRAGVYTYKYNDKNDLIEENYCFSVLDDIAGSIEINPNYEFNDKRCEKITYKYDYDKMGNWIKKIKIEEDGISRIYDRKIEYY